MKSRRRPTRPRGCARGFTLIEVMVVVLIGAVIMGVAIPNFARKAMKDPLNQATTDLLDAFREARSRAVLGNRPMQVLITAGEGIIHVEPYQPRDPEFAPIEDESDTVPTAEINSSSTASPESKPLFSAHMNPEVAFRTLVVNTHDRLADPLTVVRFYPNGTCDQFEAVLAWPRKGERKVSLEVTTSLAEVEDPR